jgi:hypothetical protein
VVTETPVQHPYVIVRPGGWGHVSDDPDLHLVVHVDEWVQVYHKEKSTYDFASEHQTLNGAHNRRNELNGTGHLVADEPAVEGVESPVETEGQEVQWSALDANVA